MKADFGSRERFKGEGLVKVQNVKGGVGTVMVVGECFSELEWGRALVM